MSVEQPGFSERIFEFAFNSEFAAAYRAVIAGVPHIPTQNQEKTLGYDVKFEVTRKGSPVKFLALQHKVAKFVDGKSGSNKFIRDKVGDPYYSTRIDPAQFNVIVKACSIPDLDFFYCLPLFHTLGSLNLNYNARKVCSSSVWIDVSKVKRLTTHESHFMAYRERLQAFVFSEEAQPAVSTSPSEHMSKLVSPKRTPSAQRTLNALLEAIRSEPAFRDHPAAPDLLNAPESHGDADHFAALGNVLSTYLDSTLLVLTEVPS